MISFSSEKSEECVQDLMSLCYAEQYVAFVLYILKVIKHEVGSVYFVLKRVVGYDLTHLAMAVRAFGTALLDTLDAFLGHTTNGLAMIGPHRAHHAF